MGHYISVKDIKPHYMRALLFKNSQFWPVLIKIRETWVKKKYHREGNIIFIDFITKT